MRLSLHILGTEVFAISTDPTPAAPEGASDYLSTGFGFTPSAGDQRWEQSPELS